MAFGGKPYNGGGSADGINRDKFIGEDQSLAWPSTATGLPVKLPEGGRVDLRGDQLNELETSVNFKSKMFELWNADDKKEFDLVRDKIINKIAVQYVRHDEWCPEKKHLMVWLEWAELFHVIP